MNSLYNILIMLSDKTTYVYSYKSDVLPVVGDVSLIQYILVLIQYYIDNTINYFLLISGILWTIYDLFKL